MGWRARRGRGIDLRLAVGVVLVVGSVLGVWAIVGGLDRSVEVYTARDTIPAGSELELEGLQRVRVVLGEHTTRYLSAETVPPADAVLTRTVGSGELIPIEAIGSAADDAVATVVVPSRGALPAEVEPGSVVDVWVAGAIERGFEPPVVLVPGAEVVSVLAVDSPGADGPLVELRLDRERLPLLLESLSAGDAIDLVPARRAA